MPGKRTANPDLSGFDYLDREADGLFYIRHPLTRRRASLKTRDRETAIARYNVIMARFEADREDVLAAAIAKKMGDLSSAPVPGHAPTLAEYAALWRENWLCVTLGESERGRHGKSKYVQEPCKVVSEHTRKVLSARTALDYAKFCHRFFEIDDAFKTLHLNQPNATQIARKALAKFQGKPTSYNHHLACLSTMLQQAKRDGHIEDNWARDIDQLIKPAKSAAEKAMANIPDDDYEKIRAKLVEFTYYGEKMDGEWLGRAADLLLVMSSRPADAVGLRDNAFDADGFLNFRARKTGRNIEIEDESGSLAETVLWFRKWKRRNNIISPYLIVYPNYFHPPLAGQPVPVHYVSRRWAEAVVDAGYEKGRWQFRHLRHTGISREKIQQGEDANKGGHQSKSGAAAYDTAEPVTKVKNTISLKRENSAEKK